jgi:hypothetical protein
MDNPQLDSLSTSIYAMPTLQLQHHSTVIDTIEGFNKSLIQKAIDTIKANSVSEPEYANEPVSITPPDSVSVLTLDEFEPKQNELNSGGTSVDSILSQLQKNLDTY